MRKNCQVAQEMTLWCKANPATTVDRNLLGGNLQNRDENDEFFQISSGFQRKFSWTDAEKKACVVVIWIDLNGAWCEKVGRPASALCNEVALIWWNRPDGQVMGS